jgi:hypothetical protein
MHQNERENPLQVLVNLMIMRRGGAGAIQYWYGI